MSEATESKFFREQKAKSLNALQSSANTWSVQPKALMQVANAVERLSVDLEEGILTKLRLMRQQQLLSTLSDRCYKNNDYTYAQSMACEDFYKKNDFKLNLLNSFVRDHMTKHFQSYEKCYQGDAFMSLPSNEEKDRAFLTCHNNWISNLKSNVSDDLEIKARTMFARPSAPVVETADDE